MTARPITTIPPAATAVGRHRPLRAAAAITGVAAVIAAGGYLATTTIWPRLHPDRGADRRGGEPECPGAG